MDKRVKMVYIALFVLFGIFGIGTYGYMELEGYSLIDAMYMTSITISTVGFGEVKPLSNAGKLFTNFLIFSGISIVIYAISNLTTFFVEGEMRTYLRGVRMNKMIEKLSNHYIVVGYGRTGKKVVEDLFNGGYRFVVIEKSEDAIKFLTNKYGDKVFYVEGDATDDETLLKAGIKRAAVVLNVLTSDADNLFVTLSAKGINKDLKVITRAIGGPGNIEKLKRAGADKIISPLEIAANRMFTTATQSEFVSFLDTMSEHQALENLQFALVELREESELVGSNLREAKIPQRTNLIVIGIEKGDDMELNPMSHTILNKGDKLLVLGNNDQINSLKKLSS